MHRLLMQQVRRHLTREGRAPAGLRSLLDSVSRCYDRADVCRDGARAAARQQRTLRATIADLAGAVAVVAHELRSPLSGLRNAAELLLSVPENQLGRQAAGLLPTMHGEIMHMVQLVNDVLDAAQLDSGRVRWSWSIVKLAPVVGRAIETARLAGGTGHAEAGHVRVEQIVEPAELAMPGDAGAIGRLIANLVGNARRHTRRGSIEVRLTRWRATWIELIVRDTGCGIAADRLGQLGRPFALGSGVGSSAAEGPRCGGAGLGLAICRSIAAAHGGRMFIDSRRGHGTVVRVLLRADLPGPRRKKGYAPLTVRREGAGELGADAEMAASLRNMGSRAPMLAK
jgi:signal transduction histidine kinase